MAESFQGLLLRHRGRTRLTQRQLATRAGVSRRSVQDWGAGLNYPDPQHLQALIAAFLETRGFTVGAEAVEAEALWAAALRQARRMQTPFDAGWWASLLARRARSAQHTDPPRSQVGAERTLERRQDWGEAPDVLGFVGRTEEMATLRSLAGRRALSDCSRAGHGRHRQDDARRGAGPGRGASIPSRVLAQCA